MRLFCSFCLFVLTLGAWLPLKAKQLQPEILPAAALPGSYLHLLTGKKVGLVINQTSKVKDSSLLDFLLVRKVNVVKIFVPEHGFRGNEDAGAHIDNSRDSATGLPLVSLYGKHKMPTSADLAEVDILVYDLQDVGVRFYTYISTLEYVYQACVANYKQLMVLDRPNPNGFYVDGPVLDTHYRSFVGMQPIPVVYGMTCGEYAAMLKGEQWVKNYRQDDLLVIKCGNYDHKKKYELPVAPSPNLRTMAAVYAYPSLCFFEGTPVSVGRGTDAPFTQYGAPYLAGKFSYCFVPERRLGASKPMFEGEKCFGERVGDAAEDVLIATNGKLQLKWLIAAYKHYPEKEKFFTPFFTKLAGTRQIEESVASGMSAEAISKQWKKQISAFMKIRKKYLLYPDF